MRLNNLRHEHLYITVKEMNSKGYSIKLLCSILGISRAAYYKWVNREKSDRENENEQILHEIKSIYDRVKGIYGYRRLADEYNATHGTAYSDKRFYRLTHISGLRAVIRKKRMRYRKTSADYIAQNLLNREFTADRANSKWVTDVTEMKYGNGKKMYLSAILDLKTREIVSFATGHSNNNQLVFSTFDLAVQKYPNAHPILHSDRGYQYTSNSFKRKIDLAQMTHSMSRVGRCIDNGPMEGFWGTLKSEMYYLSSFADYASLVKAIEEYIHFYNYERRQRNLNRMAPMSVRQLLDLAG